MHICSHPNNKYKIISPAEFKIYSPVQQFELAQNWFSYSPLSLNLNLNLKFSLVQFGLRKLNRGSVRVQFRFELISELNFGSTIPCHKCQPRCNHSGTHLACRTQPQHKLAHRQSQNDMLPRILW